MYNLYSISELPSLHRRPSKSSLWERAKTLAFAKSEESEHEIHHKWMHSPISISASNQEVWGPVTVRQGRDV